MGDAALPDQQHPDLIAVVSNQTTAAPPLILGTHPPELSSFTRANVTDGSDLGEVTDNGAAGQYLYLHGNYFGYARGVPAEVDFSGATAIAVQPADRQSEGSLKVKVRSLFVP